MSHRNETWVLFSLLALGSEAALAAPPSTAPYTTDSQFTYVEDATSQSIGQVNMIVCFMSSMRPDALVNQGDYIALVDQNQCDKNHRSSSSNSAPATVGVVRLYMTATVNSSRPTLTHDREDLDRRRPEAPRRRSLLTRTSAEPTDANPRRLPPHFCGKPTGGILRHDERSAAARLAAYYQTESADHSGPRPRPTSVALQRCGSLDAQQTEGGVTRNFRLCARGLFLRRPGFSRGATGHRPVGGATVCTFGCRRSITRNSAGRTRAPAAPTVALHWGLPLPPARWPRSQRHHAEGRGGSGRPVRTDYTVARAGQADEIHKKSRMLTHGPDPLQCLGGDASGLFSGATSNPLRLYWDEPRPQGHGPDFLRHNGCQTPTSMWCRTSAERRGRERHPGLVARPAAAAH
jgi:hypothetical protein